MITVNDLYKMKPLTQLFDDYEGHILRVPGGWIFKSAGVFVPFDNEFMQIDKLVDPIEFKED
jgi:hypothetical protein